MRVLVTGGVRSGKSRHAEALLAGRADVAYVAPGPTAEEDRDPDWAARVAAHRARRPPGWRTHETRDVAGVLRAAPGPVLVDCLGTWLTGVIDGRGLWDAPGERAAEAVHALVDEVAEAVRAATDIVLVTNEVGLGVVPSHRSGRLFRDLLGTVNQRVADACDEVHLVIAGRVLVL
ncbi:bifunctional adenosylcobinamide kinase/adenosylcobinamide-phosphate guanylyltransferase [Streptomyces marincola]|uniref:bifunctional adenosylcobinamide kinase/adenosylcobinamide-phosphate guanylyltransferase n=1 Tax=Streptomyces marincola TaxID=2878388 RepID=UPI001CF24883|nr:bifunctional adenosylcobinamide kinase/adenosylcobinamide-phosphate guanylyltransferase [Streptomyces marincola]UCM87605.1 bifunctional adenosylcobinamide kinase/adenosylcobinamide-phosphate guanylyltransferase [Streptomyces marincola]